MILQEKTESTPVHDECGLAKLACARDRIFQAASELFYRKGIKAVGVEAIAEEAQTTKMSLYRHFASKDELVAAWLRERTAQYWILWDEIRARHAGDPRGQLGAFFAQLGEFCADPNSRGCAAANAAVELTDPAHPARRVIEEHKRDVRAHLTGVCTEMGVTEPAELADSLFLLMEGAQTSVQSLGHAGPARAIAGAATALIDAHLRLGATAH
jgi:AcrR family transcriptional regulator